MKIRTLLILLQVVIICSITVGQSSVWKVTNKGKTMYLGGTIHILREQDFPLPAEFDFAYEQAEVLVFEADINSLQGEEMRTKLMNAATYGGDTTLKIMLEPAAYDTLGALFREMGMNIALFDKLRVSMTVMTITALKLQQMGMSSSGVDVFYLSKATEDGKKLVFLESVDEQINMLVDMGAGYENDFVYYSLSDLNQIETLIEEMIASWRIGSLELSEELVNEMKQDYPVLYQDLLVDRNNEWIKTLKKLLKSLETEFVLVGDLHMYGEDGLLKLLKEMGCEVEQIEVTDIN